MLELRSPEAPDAASGALLLAEEKPAIRVILAAPRGFCAGVRRAIDAVRDALAKHGAPVFVRRAIVHNLEVVRMLEAEGAVFVKELDEVPAGSVVLFSAHGISPAIAGDAARRGLIAYDAVCPLVAKVHREVERHQRSGRQIVLIGHQGHPEIEGTLGHVSSVNAHVVKSVEEVEGLPLEVEMSRRPMPFRRPIRSMTPRRSSRRFSDAFPIWLDRSRATSATPRPIGRRRSATLRGRATQSSSLASDSRQMPAALPRSLPTIAEQSNWSPAPEEIDW